MRNIGNWLPILQQIITLMKLLRTMEPTTRRLRDAKPTALIGFNISTHIAARGSCNYYIGTGIDHLKPAYRLQKRFRKHIVFVQSIACSQNSHPFCAPTSRQHRTNVVLADLLHKIAIAPLDFRQHQVSNTTLYDDFSKHMGNSFSIIGGIFTPLSLSPHVLTPHTCESAPNFWQHHPQDANAPTSFRQHSVLQSTANSPFLPSSIFNTALYDDLLEHMGNSHLTDRGISTPLFFFPHVLRFSNGDYSIPISQRLCSLINPDGPGNILLFDLSKNKQHTRKRSKQEPLRPHIPVGLGSEKLLHPFAITTFYMDFQHMGKIVPVGLIIPTSIYLSPHASPVLVHRVTSEWYLRPQLYFQHKKTNQNFTKGSKQEPYPSDRPLFNPVGPGTILNWPSGAPHATDLASKHHDYGYWQHFYIFLESLTMLDNIHLDATELAADHLFFWQPRAHSSTIFLPYTSASYPLVEHYNARLWQQILIPGRHWSNVSRSKVSIYKELPVDLLVQSSSERDPSLPYPSFSCYPPKSKFDLELSSSHPTSYGISHSQIRVLLSLHRLTFCHLFSDSLD